MKLSDEMRSIHGQDGAVVLDIRDGRLFRLNPVGSRILELLRNGLMESQIADTLSDEFLADRGTVERDLAEFLAHLEEHRWLRSESAAKTP